MDAEDLLYRSDPVFARRVANDDADRSEPSVGRAAIGNAAGDGDNPFAGSALLFTAAVRKGRKERTLVQY